MGSKVFGAAFHGKLAKLLKYLEAEDDTLLDCPSVDWADAGGMTALHGACQEGHAECVELLLRAGAVADRASNDGLTPLHIACENGHVGCVPELLRAKASLTAVDKANAATPLHCACLSGSADCVEALLGARAGVDAVDTEGATPLILAAHRGHTRCVELLLAAGADESKEFDAKTAFELADEAGHSACAALLRSTAPGAAAKADGSAEEGAPTAGEAAESTGGIKGERVGVSKLLGDMREQMKQAGIGGAEIFEQKERELAKEQQELRALEAKQVRAPAAPPCPIHIHNPRPHSHSRAMPQWRRSECAPSAPSSSGTCAPRCARPIPRLRTPRRPPRPLPRPPSAS